MKLLDLSAAAIAIALAACGNGEIEGIAARNHGAGAGGADGSVGAGGTSGSTDAASSSASTSSSMSTSSSSATSTSSSGAGGEAGASGGGGGGGAGDGGAGGCAGTGGGGGAGGTGGSTGSGGSGGGCAGDPTAGFSEYMDTFNVQHPYDLQEADRFTFENGVYTTWVLRTDKPFKMGSDTGPRTEMRWSQNWSTGERMWDGDVMIESPSSQACIMQVKGNDPPGGEAMYLQVNGGALRNSVQRPFLMDAYGKWMNVKTAYNTATRVGRVWIDNCLVYTTTYSQSASWYFKNGTYGCNVAMCKTHFKNIRFWMR